jgi:hypothetical protein
MRKAFVAVVLAVCLAVAACGADRPVTLTRLIDGCGRASPPAPR